MQTRFSHIQVNIRAENASFYKDLMSFMGWQTLYEDGAMLGVGDEHHSSLWFLAVANDASNDYDGAGVNHIGIGTETQADVDAVSGYLAEHGVTALFETPRHRPEFSQGEGNTYYQVMFESPDRVLFEVVYIGPKDA